MLNLEIINCSHLQLVWVLQSRDPHPVMPKAKFDLVCMFFQTRYEILL